jgi:peroxiredoxin
MTSQAGNIRRCVALAALSLFASTLCAEEADKGKLWYSAGLEKLGFTVFPKSVALDDFGVRSPEGTETRLSGLKGKVVLLNFWATWCPPCRAEMPAIDALWRKTKDKAFTVMGVSVGEDSVTVKEFVERQGFLFPIYVDPSGALGSAFGVRSIPTTYVLDKSGAAIAGKIGGAAYDGPESLALFAELASR